jgi:hypothetical protein
MASQTTKLQIFVASPSDVQPERDCLKKVVDDLNKRVAAKQNLHLDLITWQTHTHPGMGKDPQDVINKQIQPTDIFVGIMWKRFGTPTERAPSGTVEEFQSAYKRWKKNPQTHIMFYFNNNAVDIEGDLKKVRGDLMQVIEVRTFRESLTKVGLIADYRGVDDFEEKVRGHLENLVLHWSATADAVEAKEPTPSASSKRKAVWPPPPQRPGLFVGRDAGLKELRRRLGADKNRRAAAKAPTIAMFGVPGVGKTTLAAELTWDEQIRKAFPDGALWTTVGEESELATLGEWGAALGEDGQKLAGAMTTKAAWSELRNVLKDRRMLLVVDDVWELQQVADFKEILGPGCALVTTTRDRRLAADLADEPEKHAYELPELTDEGARELLSKLAGAVVKKYRQKCLELVKTLGRLPLTLQVAGRLLNEENKKDPSLAEKLLDEMIAGKKFLEAAVPPDRRSRKDKTALTVAALLKRSTDRLDKTTRERFATLGRSARPAIFSPETLKNMWRVRDPQPTIDTLINHGLLEPLGNGKYQMHAVLVSFADSLLRAPQRR